MVWISVWQGARPRVNNQQDLSIFQSKGRLCACVWASSPLPGPCCATNKTRWMKVHAWKSYWFGPKGIRIQLQWIIVPGVCLYPLLEWKKDRLHISNTITWNDQMNFDKNKETSIWVQNTTMKTGWLKARGFYKDWHMTTWMAVWHLEK